jgi:hypothetical protein
MVVLDFLTHLRPFDSPFLLLFFLSKPRQHRSCATSHQHQLVKLCPAYRVSPVALGVTPQDTFTAWECLCGRSFFFLGAWWPGGSVVVGRKEEIDCCLTLVGLRVKASESTCFAGRGGETKTTVSEREKHKTQVVLSGYAGRLEVHTKDVRQKSQHAKSRNHN